MIVFDLKCANDHVFEAYFADSATYESQVKAGDVACPVCGDTSVAKAPMAPNIAVSGRRKGEDAPRETPDRSRSLPPPPPEAVKAISALRRMRTFVEQNFDNVGKRFPEEARKIHYGDVEARNIYGDATKEKPGRSRTRG